MKRKLLLFALISVFSCAFFGFAAEDVDAASETTYPVSHDVYSNDFGQTVFSGNNMISKNSSGIKNTVFNIKDYNEYDTNVFRMSFYMRGKTVYYSLTPLDYYYYQNGVEPQEIWSVNINTGKKKQIVSGAGDIIGGYGSDILTRRWDTGAVYRIKGNTMKKLFTVQKGKSMDNSCISLFQGKLYYSNKCYNLDSGKTSTFTAHSIVAYKNYMYYVSGGKNLVCMNKSGKKVYYEKKVKDVIGGNNNKNVIFRKASGDSLTIYRADSKGRIYKLTTQKKLEKAAFNGKLTCDSTKAVLGNGKVCFCLQSGTTEGAIIAVPNKGGTLSKSIPVYDGVGYPEVRGKSLYFTQLGFDDFSYNFGCKMTIK